MSENLQVLLCLISKVCQQEPSLQQLTHEGLVHELQTTQSSLVMLAFQCLIDGALSNNTSRHQYFPKLTPFVAFVDSVHHYTLSMEWTKKWYNVRVFVWVFGLEYGYENVNWVISN